LDELRRAVLRRLPDPWMRVRVHVPYADAKLMARLHAEGRVLATDYDAAGAHVEAEVPGVLAVQLRALTPPAEPQAKRRRKTG
jgi:GTP-binding protein HflX